MPRDQPLETPSVDLTVVVPTFNEEGNVAELLRRLGEALPGRHDVEVLFVDDSTDGTADAVRLAALSSALPVRLLHRAPDERQGGLAGAVAAGIAAARGEHVVVMDGDLQHPPELVPLLRERSEGVDLVVASRYCGAGDASGLSSSWRRAVSSGSTLLARSCFPRRVGRVCTDPMTGFFCVRRDAVQLDRLRPRGFKILLEILARHDLRVREVPFLFGERHDGASKASWRNGAQFLRQMAALRMGRMARFAAVGALGTVVNLALMWLLMREAGLHYLPSAVLATEIAIVHNFVLQERFVFADLRDGRHGRWMRALHSLLYNNADALARLPLLALLVELLAVPSVLAQAVTLAVAFLARFFFVSTVTYAPRRDDATGPGPSADVLAIAPVLAGCRGAE
ncbi:GtrA family protein [Blastococcus sp. TF02A_35]|uniref:GtrA family protein n=1 Tax=Blastococcus sp. TF02A-35 TaxID=2559612 RepID=UPI001073D938|nr:GtrA family protein [Blastococcus sp. TF02A_35]TFV52874.1 glycosyltransferase [Blastococcus sp. TF02A_35]